MTDIGRLNFVCIDDSEFSENGLNWYLDNHHRDEDTVGLVHVHEIPKLSTFDLFGGNIAVVEAYHQKLQESIKKAHDIQDKYEDICSEKGLKHKFFMADSEKKPGHAICHLAKEHGASLIVIGQRGLGTVSRAFLGSTSDFVLHHAHVTVLVVPTAKK